MDLISLDRAKAQLPAAPDCDDALIATLITACSNVIEADCSRRFTQATYDERLDGTGTPYLYINNPPIQTVVSVRTGQLPAVYLLFSDPTNTVQSATVDVTASGIVLNTVYAGNPTTDTFAFATFPTFGVFSAGVNALPAQEVGRWTATQPPQFAQWQTSDLSADLGSWSARNLSVSLNVYWYALPHFRYAAERGEIFSPTTFAPGYQNWRVRYVGGFAEVPAEIQQACAELVQLTYSTLRANPLMSSETLDRYSYSRAARASYDQLSVTSKKAIQQHKIYNVSRSW